MNARRIVLVSGLVVCLLGAAAHAQARRLSIVKKGKPTARIVIPAGCGSWTRRAADWVRHYVKEATGADLPVATETANLSGTIISVGQTKLAEKAGIRTDDLEYDGCKLIVKGKVLYLIGRDQKGPGEHMYYTGAKGTCRAAVTFLEEFLGVRWFIPSPEGEVVPKTRNLYVPGNLRIEFSPAFAYAFYYIYLVDYFGNGFFKHYGTFPACYANNFRKALLVHNYGGDNLFATAVPVEKYYAEHPEYFAVIGGKRYAGPYTRLCLSNPEVKRLLLKEIQSKFDQGYDMVELCHEDGYKRCECPECEKMDQFSPRFQPIEDYWEYLREHPCERLHVPFKWIIDECKKSHPDKKVLFMAYNSIVLPSKKFDHYGDNVVVQIGHDNVESIIPAWKGKVSAMALYGYWFNYSICAGFDSIVSPKKMTKKMRYYHDSGVIGIYFAGAGMNWGLQGPTFYVTGKLLGDPKADYRALMQEYCEGLYGEAREEMLDFFDLLYARIDINHDYLATGDRRMPLSEKYLMRYPPRVLQELDRLLRRAEGAAQTERSKQWVRLTRDQFDLTKTLTNAFIAYRAYQAAETPDNIREVKERLDEFEAYRKRILSYEQDYSRRWFPGHGALCLLLTSENKERWGCYWPERRKEIGGRDWRGKVIGWGSTCIREPITLDFDRLEPPTLTAPRAPGAPRLDGAIEKNEWQGTAPQLLRNMTSRTTEVKTYVRVMYDEQNLYIAYECAEPKMEGLTLKETGRDGPVWQLDCVELFLDPESSRRRYYHFIAAPVRNAFYDDRTGFKTQNDQDRSWNGDWRYAFKIDKANKTWCLEMSIPFKALGVAVPKSGEAWLGNFGRERYAQLPATGYRQPRLYLWAQGESAGFTDPSAFAQIIFN